MLADVLLSTIRVRMQLLEGNRVGWYQRTAGDDPWAVVIYGVPLLVRSVQIVPNTHVQVPRVRSTQAPKRGTGSAGRQQSSRAKDWLNYKYFIKRTWSLRVLFSEKPRDLATRIMIALGNRDSVLGTWEVCG